MGILDFIIASDPSTITITRHTKTADYGGSTWTPADVYTDVPVRIYYISTRKGYMSEVILPDGEVKQINCAFLTTEAITIVNNHDAYDTFVHGGRTYRIISARPYDDSNAPDCLQCECVAV